MLWRRNTDSTFEDQDGVLQMRNVEVYEASNEAPTTRTIEKQCRICGEVMVCDQTVWALDDVYLVRHGHEILLDFGAPSRWRPTSTTCESTYLDDAPGFNLPQRGRRPKD